MVKKLRYGAIGTVKEKMKDLADHGTSVGLAAFEEMGNLLLRIGRKERFQELPR